jgi:hypothetical protein
MPDAVDCPHCGAKLRRTDGTIPRTAGAVLLGLAAAASVVAAASCSNDVTLEGAGGAGGATASSTVAHAAQTTGPSMATTTAATTVSSSVDVSSSSNSTTDNSIASTYGVGPSSGPSGSSGTGGFCGGFSVQDPSCDQCLQDECCAEVAACDIGTPCYDLLTCEASCADAACIAACDAAFASGAAAASSLSQCFFTTCGFNCTLTGICSTGTTTQNPLCDTCLAAACCAELTACLDPDPQACIDCFGDPAVCDPDGTAAVECISSQCDVTCGF